MQHESFFRRRATLAALNRFFFALLPPARDARRTALLAEKLGPEWQVQTPARLHITLAITGDHLDYPQPVVDRLLCAGDRVAAAPFTVTLDRLSVSNRSTALRPSKTIKPLAALHHAIAAQMRASGVTMREEWRFNPHMTLSYRTGGAPSTRQVTALEWPADEFVLIHSAVGLTQHRLLQRWPLTPPAVDQYDLF